MHRPKMGAALTRQLAHHRMELRLRLVCVAVVVAWTQAQEAVDTSVAAPEPVAAQGERTRGVTAEERAFGLRQTATFIPNFSPDEEEETLTEEDNIIGKSPCPRGQRGFTCRQQLALSAFSCTDGPCARCRLECSSLEPSEWPGCCRDHMRCCRDLAHSCHQCDQPVLKTFCNAAFKRCN